MTNYFVGNNEKRAGKRVPGTIYQKHQITLSQDGLKSEFEVNTKILTKLNDVQDLKDEIKNASYKFHM